MYYCAHTIHAGYLPMACENYVLFHAHVSDEFAVAHAHPANDPDRLPRNTQAYWSNMAEQSLLQSMSPDI